MHIRTSLLFRTKIASILSPINLSFLMKHPSHLLISQLQILSKTKNFTET